MRIVHIVLLLQLSLLSGLSAQSPEAVAKERTELLRWLSTSPVSPFRAVAQAPLRGGVTLGSPGTDVPLNGVPRHMATESGGKLILQGPGGSRPLARGRPVPLGGYTLVASGVGGRGVLTVFQKSASPRAVEYFPYDTLLSFVVRLDPPAVPAPVRLLAADGVEVDAAEAGAVTVLLGRSPGVLAVRRIPSSADESELEIYFRDRTSGATTYPAGRFVSLIPLGQQTYRLDFNRARSPFCAYSTAYACPAPWPGNTLSVPIAAGEKYAPTPSAK